MPDRYPPEDPREWLNRARSNLQLAKNTDTDEIYYEDLCYNARAGSRKSNKGGLYLPPDFVSSYP